MAHFAEIDSFGNVLQVVVVGNQDVLDHKGRESEQVGIKFLKDLYGKNTNWVQTSVNDTFRKNYAGIGHRYDARLDAFIPDRPYPSWVLNETTVKWEPPTPKPVSRSLNEQYTWDEIGQQWIMVDVLFPLP